MLLNSSSFNVYELLSSGLIINGGLGSDTSLIIYESVSLSLESFNSNFLHLKPDWANITYMLNLMLI